MNLKTKFFYISLALISWLAGHEAAAQGRADTTDSRQIVVQRIEMLGNRRTKPHIITRELDFAPGDTLSVATLPERLMTSRNNIFNTRLFVTADLVVLGGTPDTLPHLAPRTIFILVKERWYTFPGVTFQLADRNFNEWWRERGRDLGRTDYGVRFIQRNFRGRNETLRLVLQAGFTQKYELSYQIPYINQQQNAGLGFAFSYATNRAVAFQTQDHKLLFTTDDLGTLRTRFFAGVNYSRRQGLYSVHNWQVRHHYNTIADTVARLNPSYFLDGRTRQRFSELTYSFTHDRRDIRAYALDGHFVQVLAQRQGLLSADDLQRTALNLSLALYRPIGKRFFWAGDLRGQVSDRRRLPFLQFTGLGYGPNYVRGYELYVVDGQHFGLARQSWRYRLLSSRYEINAMPIPQFRTLPVELYVKIFTDAGYVRNQFTNDLNPRFSNTFLGGMGLGLDLVTYYDTVIRLEGSVNRAGETGFYLHFSRDI